MSSLLKRNGPIPQPPEVRFMRHVKKADSCWLWTGGTTKKGYGIFYLSKDRKGMTASAASYLLFKGEIPEGLDVCHTCDNPPCVNPDHLFTGTRKVNMEDAKAKGRIFTPRLFGTANGEGKRTHCNQGHPFSGENLVFRYGSTTQRSCLTCRRADRRRSEAKRRERNATLD